MSNFQSLTTTWSEMDLGQVATLQRGYDLPYRLRSFGDVPVVTSTGVTDTHSEAKEQAPGVVTGRYGTIGQVFYIEEDYWPHNTTLFIKDFHGNDPLFVSYLLRTIDFHSHSGKSGVPGVNRNDLHALRVRIPPTIDEQRLIVAALSDMDELLGGLDRLIAKKRDLKQATMQQLLTGKTRLPGFDGEWKSFSIGNLFEITAGRDLVKNEYSGINSNAHPFPIYANSIFNDGLYGYSSFKEYEAGCVTVTARGTLGYACYRSAPFVAIGRLIVLSPKKEIDSFFLAEAINHRIEFASESTGVPQLTAPQIAKYELFIPVVEEQTAIASILSDMDTAIAALEQRRNKTHDIKQGMMQELLTGKTRLV
jgi:type I restriction enzyme, S subunit